MTELRDRVALVTGSSRGIGAAIARRFARAGARVALHGRDADALSAMERELRAEGGQIIAVQGDVTRFDEVERVRERVEASLGPIDVLVANAGGNLSPYHLPLEQIDEESFRKTVDVNLMATFFTLKSVLPGMKERRSGNVITISSAAARRAHPMSPLAYAAAKAAIELLTQDVAAQAGPFNVRVNCIAPETILTEKNQRQIPEQQKAALVDTHPLKRLGTPDDVANAALFLASNEASWITGVILDIAGGAVLPR